MGSAPYAALAAGLQCCFPSREGCAGPWGLPGVLVAAWGSLHGMELLLVHLYAVARSVHGSAGVQTFCQADHRIKS